MKILQKRGQEFIVEGSSSRWPCHIRQVVPKCQARPCPVRLTGAQAVFWHGLPVPRGTSVPRRF